MRRNRFDRKPQANHRRQREMDDDFPYARVQGNAIPKHKHVFKAWTLEKDQKKGDKIQIVECTIVGCGLRFVRDKEFIP